MISSDIFEWDLDDITSSEKTKKKSYSYIACFVCLNVLSAILTVYPKFIILYTILAYINEKMSFTIYTIVLSGSLIFYLIHLVMLTRNKKKKEKLKIDLDV